MAGDFVPMIIIRQINILFKNLSFIEIFFIPSCKVSKISYLKLAMIITVLLTKLDSNAITVQ
jgi:hypothetical protein